MVAVWDCITKSRDIPYHEITCLFFTMAEKADKPKKRGTPSNFQGQRGAFLESWMEAYCEASRKKTTAKMWDRLFPQYWANFSWHSRTEELVGPIFVNTDEDWVAFAMPKEILTPEEETRKKEVIKGTQKVRNARRI
jgi:hypothetical protein